MFRSRRANLVKRLWKCKAAAKTTRARATDRDDASDAETAPSLDEAADELETKSLAQSMLKRLDEQHLETLIQAVESRGAEPTDCVLLSRDELRLGNRTIAPHVFCCRLWRWPRLDAVGGEGLLKRLPCCWAAGHDRDADVVCCNPYHWSRLVLPDSPPPPYCKVAEPHCVFTKHDAPVTERNEDEAVSIEAKEPVPNEACNDDSAATPAVTAAERGSSCGATWCRIAYWEQRTRVGRLFAVTARSVDVFQEAAPRGAGLCLATLQPGAGACDAVRRTRAKIGRGVTVSRESDGVWIYNRSAFPVFVNSPTLDMTDTRRAFVVCKVPAGHCACVFEWATAATAAAYADGDGDGPYDPLAIRVSFAKGWGARYTRQFVTSCPCWAEVLLRGDT